MSARMDDEWSETTQPIIEAEESPAGTSVLCLVLAFNRMRPTAPSAWFVFSGQSMAVGRGLATELDIDNQRISVRDPAMSSKHFMVNREGDRWLLLDAGSTNGTFVNGTRVARHALRAGDMIEAGACHFV